MLTPIPTLCFTWDENYDGDKKCGFFFVVFFSKKVSSQLNQNQMDDTVPSYGQ